MKKHLAPFLSLTLITTLPSQMNAQIHTWPDVKAPVAETKSYVRDIHGDKVEDNYYWMIDFFKKGPDSSKVVAYLEEENNYLDKMMAGTNQMQENLFNEMKNRIKEKDESVPVFKNGYFYYTRTEEGKQYYKYCRKKGNLSAPEEILLDVDALAQGLMPILASVVFRLVRITNYWRWELTQFPAGNMLFA